MESVLTNSLYFFEQGELNKNVVAILKKADIKRRVAVASAVLCSDKEKH